MRAQAAPSGPRAPRWSPQGGASKTTKDPTDAHGKSSPGARGRRERHVRRTGRREHNGSASLHQLTSDVCERIRECALTAADEARIDNCVDQLRAAARALGEDWVVKLFGSVANGFCTRASDIDAAFAQEEVAGEPPPEPLQAASIMKDRLIPILREQPQFEIVEEILGAKVPILKLRFDGVLDVDLSCNNQLPFQNTQLLKAYSSLDSNVRDLGIAVKLWAKAAGVCGACQGKLSSYTFTLLTIYFMQVHQDVKLPCLPPAAFAGGGGEAGHAKLAAARSVWSNRLPLGELLFRFFMFYAQDFGWGTEVVSVRLGHRLQYGDSFFEGLRGRWHMRLHVEDPYQLERNLNCVLGELEEARLREAFGQAAFCIQCGRSPCGLGPAGEEASAGGARAAEGEDAAAVVCEFDGRFATSPPPTPHAGLGSPPPSPESPKVCLESSLAGGALLGSLRSGGSSASTRCSLSDGALESSGDEHHQAERDRQWWKCMAAADAEGTKELGDGPRASDVAGARGEQAAATSAWLTAQDLELRMSARPSSLRPGAGDMRLPVGTCYSSKATEVIAKRVAKACQKHVSWQ